MAARAISSRDLSANVLTTMRGRGGPGPARRGNLSFGMDQNVIGCWGQNDRVRPFAAQEPNAGIEPGDVFEGTLAQPELTERLLVPAHGMLVAGTAVDKLPRLPRHRPGRRALELAETHKTTRGLRLTRWSLVRVGRRFTTTPPQQRHTSNPRSSSAFACA